MALAALLVNRLEIARELRACVDVVVAQMARHQCNWDWKRSGGLGEVRYQGAWTFLAGAGGQNKNADIGIFVDQLDDLFRGVAFANDAVRRDFGDLLRACGKLVECGIRRLLRLSLHEIGNAEPLLIAITRLNYAQHNDLRFRAPSALRRPVDGAVAFLCVVDDHQIFPLVAGLVAAALAAHGRDAPVRSYAL